MGGIAGIIDLGGKRDIDRKALDRMTRVLAHRGPDGAGTHIEPGIGIGHRRLGPMEDRTLRQPFRSARGGTVVACDGTVLNFPALRRELEAASRPLRTGGEAEAVAELIDLRGPEALDHFIGAFAFVAWDPRSEQLLLVRDRFGEKPLFTCVTDTGFLLFASEIDAILATGWAPDVLDADSVCDFLFYGHIAPPKTIYRFIRQVAPGHILTFRRGRPLPPPRAWWHIKTTTPAKMDAGAAADALLPLLDTAVAVRVPAEGTATLAASGGLPADAVARATATRGVRTISDTASGQDEPGAGTVAKLLPALGALFGEPHADPGIVARLLAGGDPGSTGSVMMSATGASTVFAADGHHRDAYRAHAIRRALPYVMRVGLSGPIGALWPDRPQATSGGVRWRPVLKATAENHAAGYARLTATMAPERYQRLVAPELRAYRPQAIVEQAILQADTDDPLLAAQIADFATSLPGGTLTTSDRAAAALGIEERRVFLDHRLVEWALSLPRALKAGPQGALPLLRPKGEAMAADDLSIPSAAPVDQWFRAEGGTLLDEIIVAEAWRDSGYLDGTGVEEMADRHRRGKGQFGKALWAVLMLQLFLTRDRSARPAMLTAIAPKKRGVDRDEKPRNQDARAVA